MASFELHIHDQGSIPLAEVIYHDSLYETFPAFHSNVQMGITRMKIPVHNDKCTLQDVHGDENSSFPYIAVQTFHKTQVIACLLYVSHLKLGYGSTTNNKLLQSVANNYKA